MAQGCRAKVATSMRGNAPNMRQFVGEWALMPKALANEATVGMVGTNGCGWTQLSEANAIG